VRSLEVVFVGVVSGRRIDFAQVEEEFAIQQFQAHLGMEAFRIGVFPRSAGFDVSRPDLGLAQPLFHGLGHEVRPIVTVVVLRLTAAADYDLFQGVDDSPGREAAASFEQQAFSGVFVDDREDAHCATIGCAVLDKVVAPDLIGTTCAAAQSQTGPHPCAACSAPLTGDVRVCRAGRYFKRRQALYVSLRGVVRLVD
jgi:hypothetical protein